MEENVCYCMFADPKKAYHSDSSDVSEKIYWAESPNNTKVIYIMMRTKAGKWVEIEKRYSPTGFTEEAIVEIWHQLHNSIYITKQYGIKTISHAYQFKILNSMRKQVYGPYNMLLQNYFNRYVTPNVRYSEYVREVNIRWKTIEDGVETVHEVYNKYDPIPFLKKFICDSSDKHNGIKKIVIAPKCKEDNYLNWFKVTFNDNFCFTVATYSYI